MVSGPFFTTVNSSITTTAERVNLAAQKSEQYSPAIHQSIKKNLYPFLLEAYVGKNFDSDRSLPASITRFPGLYTNILNALDIKGISNFSENIERLLEHMGMKLVDERFVCIDQAKFDEYWVRVSARNFSFRNTNYALSQEPDDLEERSILDASVLEAAIPDHIGHGVRLINPSQELFDAEAKKEGDSDRRQAVLLWKSITKFWKSPSVETFCKAYFGIIGSGDWTLGLTQVEKHQRGSFFLSCCEWAHLMNELRLIKNPRGSSEKQRRQVEKQNSVFVGKMLALIASEDGFLVEDS